MERRGNRASNILTGADGLYNGRSVSRQGKTTHRISARASCELQLDTRIRQICEKKKEGGLPFSDSPVCREKTRLIGGRDGASNRPRRAALEH